MGDSMIQILGMGYMDGVGLVEVRPFIGDSTAHGGRSLDKSAEDALKTIQSLAAVTRCRVNVWNLQDNVHVYDIDADGRIVDGVV